MMAELYRPEEAELEQLSDEVSEEEEVEEAAEIIKRILREGVQKWNAEKYFHMYEQLTDAQKESLFRITFGNDSDAQLLAKLLISQSNNLGMLTNCTQLIELSKNNRKVSPSQLDDPEVGDEYTGLSADLRRLFEIAVPGLAERGLTNGFKPSGKRSGRS